jgi:GNAT superfamily N-acetyltransferase
MNEKYTLRTAEQKDAKFLFQVKIEAMKTATSILRTEPFIYEKEFAEYLKKFEPKKIQVIQFEDKDIGRLRIVRSPESIYIGAIQILPEFQSRGIGSAILTDLIHESESTGIPVTLEVHHINERAIYFYKKFGFQEVGNTEKQILMKYVPKSPARVIL